MKKVALFLVLACLAAGFLFAQDYTVQNVTGRALKGTGYNKAAITAGEILSSGTIVSISAGASLVFTDGEHTFTITAGYSGTIADSPAVARTRRGAMVRIDRRPVRPSTPQEMPAIDNFSESRHEAVLHEHEQIKIEIDTAPLSDIIQIEDSYNSSEE